MSRAIQGNGYWNEYWETLQRKRLEEIHLKRIRWLLKYAYENSKLYHRKYHEKGIKPEDIRTMDDFVRKVPFTTKDEILAAQSEAPPFGGAIACDYDDVLHIFQTSGTTGTPLRIPFTYYDTVKYGEDWAYGFWAVGIRPSDSFYFAFGWGMFTGFWSCYWGVKRMGGKVISGGGASTEDRIKHMQVYKPTVLVATPTYAIHLAETAKRMGVDPKSLGLKYFYGAGEPGPTALPKLREELENTYGIKAYELYGLGEVGAIAPACPTQKGTHLNESNYHCMVADPENGDLVAEGERGENIVTSFAQLTQPVIKYKTKDIVEWHYSETCECGRTWILYKGTVLGRVDYVAKIRGVNVYQTAVENLVRSVPGSSPYLEMHIDLDERSMDHMLVRVEADPSVPKESYKDLEQRVAEELRANLGVRINVEFVPPGSLPRYELKAKKMFDHRPRERRIPMAR
ncbi:MAG: AMP-binding protein [Candidatus Caldarchaeum sp.]|uniref:Phenylacetate--CoA ligase family protein n=1 Tax=Caldiarchaeum subterraneum TaxID=311458 RepID=A0A7C5LG90_CALS0